MKRNRAFKEGDKVFAKLKGYPAWPAVVIGKNGKKFDVQFYGTGESGSIKPEDMFYYLKNKEQMIKGSKKKEFKEAIDEIEKAIEEGGGIDGDNSPPDEDVPAPKRKRSNSERSNDSVSSKNTSNAKNMESDRDSVSNMSESTMDPSEKNMDDGDQDKEDDETGNEEDEEEDGPNQGQNDEDTPFVPDLKIVSEANLKNWIIYMDSVRSNPNFYRNMIVEPREYDAKQAFPVLLPSGKYAGLKLHKTWPLNFTNEYEAAAYDSDVASRLLLLKESIATGETSTENDTETFLEDFNLTEAEIKRDAEMKLINSKYKRVERLRQESSLVELDAKIKNCLGLAKADAKKALNFLNSMLELNIDEIMLKKHSHVVEMIRRLRKYIGNAEEWNLSQEELTEFLTDAQNLRAKADEVYKKFQNVVKLPQGMTNFWDGFNEVVKKFRDDCKFLSNREVFTLCAEPYTRQAIIDRLEQEEELQEADIHRPIEVETDKVGESK